MENLKKEIRKEKDECARKCRSAQKRWQENLIRTVCPVITANVFAVAVLALKKEPYWPLVLIVAAWIASVSILYGILLYRQLKEIKSRSGRIQRKLRLEYGYAEADRVANELELCIFAAAQEKTA